MIHAMSIEEIIKNKAIELGFDLVGVTDANAISKKDIDILKNFLKNDNSGGMKYLHNNFDKRICPKNLLESAKSVICVGLNYKPIHQPSFDNEQANCEIADYAKYEDYHKFMKIRLFKLAEFIAENVSADVEYKVCVDSVPLAERSLAAKAGMGFIGKNKMLINPKLGLNLLLGELITNIGLKSDQPIKNLCAGCDKCLSACPGGAFTDGNFNSNRCVSYLTIEYKGEFEESQKKMIGNSLFGCDRCIKACPFYKNAPVRKNAEFKFKNPLNEIPLSDLLYWDEKQFKIKLAGTALERTGLPNLKRNALACLENISYTDQGTMNMSVSPFGLSQPE